MRTLNHRWFIWLACAAGITVLFPASISHGVQQTQPAPPCARSVGEAAGLQYRMSVFGRCRPDETLPLVISLHGMGDRPRELFNELPLPVRVVMPRAPLPWGTGYSWFSHRSAEVSGAVLAPEIKKAAARVAGLIDSLRERYPTHGLPVVTGVSQGGMLTFALAMHHQESVGEAFPVAGFLPRQLWPRPRAKRSVVIHAMHGQQDIVVPPAPTEAMITQLAAQGHPITLETYANAGHDMTPEMHARRYLQLMRVLRTK